MKNIKHIPLLLILLLFTGCQKVIELPLTTAPPRLVVDASINWVKGTTGNSQKIKLTTTTDYYSTIVPTVSGATVFVTAADNSVFNFTEASIPGDYVCNNFVPILNQNYTLTVIYKGETYIASETMKPVPPIDKIEQKDNGGITGDNIEVKAYFTDNGATKDFYLFQYKPSIASIPSYGVTKDEFYQGNQVFGLYSNDKLKAGDHIEFTLSGISERYFNYMSLILSITRGGGGPFQSPPATVHGNLINTTNESNYAFGYFNLSESDYEDYVIQ